MFSASLMICLNSATFNNELVWLVNVKLVQGAAQGAFTFFACDQEWRARILATWLHYQDESVFRSFYCCGGGWSDHPLAKVRDYVKTMNPVASEEEAIAEINAFVQQQVRA